MSEQLTASTPAVDHKMKWLRLRLFAESPFATPLRGDTLFGQLCWQIRHAEGETTLKDRLDGYCQQRPFAIISDPCVADHLPRPQAPNYLLGLDNLDAKKRKAVKNQRWLPLDAASEPLHQWANHLCDGPTVLERAGLTIAALRHTEFQPHNSINRLTMTTGEEFAPYSSEQHWLHPQLGLDIYLLHDERIDAETLLARLSEIGQLGYGKDASIGKGRFHLQRLAMPEWSHTNQANSWLTLAPCAPQGQTWSDEESFYSPMVHFGRHGSALVVMGQPYKNPLLLADTGALLTSNNRAARQFVGIGLGGNGTISTIQPATVHQGYAPVVPVLAFENH